MKIDIISLFFNNETIISNYETNIINLNNSVLDIYFILIYNNSKDNTLFELEKLKTKYNNVSVILSNSNGCSLGKNIGIRESRKDCEYLFFLDSDITIDISCINECLNNIYPDIKFVGYYGGNDSNNIYIGGTHIYNTTIINQNDKSKYITAGCSLICKQFIQTNNLWFDEYYDPFIMQDVDFSFKVLKYSKIKKLKEIDTIKHKQSSTTGQFNKLFYNWQLLKNSIYVMNKYNINKPNIFSQTPLNQFINLNILDMVVNYYANYSVKLYCNRGKTLLYTMYNYLQFDNIDYNYQDTININIDIDKFIKLNNITTLIIDFQYYLQNYEKISLINNNNNINIELILDLKYIDFNNFNKIHNITKIYTFYTIYELLLKHIFNNSIPIFQVKYKLLNNTNKLNYMKKNHIIIHYDDKYEKLYTFLNNVDTDHIKISILYNHKEIINIINNNENNIYINICNDIYYMNMLKKMNIWIISTNNYPYCEMINDNINGNVIAINTLTYINDSNKIINDSIFNINNIISFITNKYLL